MCCPSTSGPWFLRPSRAMKPNCRRALWWSSKRREVACVSCRSEAKPGRTNGCSGPVARAAEPRCSVAERSRWLGDDPVRRQSGFAAGGLLLLIGGCCALNSFIIRDRADRVPRMTLSQLAQRGPGPDGYVRLTDLRPCRQGPVFWRDGLSPGHIELYIPAYPAGLEHEPEPGRLSYLLEILDEDQRRLLLEPPRPVEVTC